MKQLNKNTGEIIEIKDIKKSGIKYSIFENKFCLDRKLFEVKKYTNEFDKTYTPVELAEFSELEFETAQHQILEIETDFELSNDFNNWLITDRSLRIFLLNSFVNNVLLDAEHEALAIILNREINANKIAETKFIFNTGNTTVAYFFEVSNEDAPIIQPYLLSGDIILETL